MCRDCREYLPEGSFSFRSQVPDILKHTQYCRVCFENEILPAREADEATLEKARNAYFFFRTQSRPVPTLKRAKHPVKVENCTDRDETILRLAFLAVELGYNGIFEGLVECEKVRNEGYQTSRWSGVGIPIEVDTERFEKQSSRN